MSRAYRLSIVPMVPHALQHDISSWCCTFKAHYGAGHNEHDNHDHGEDSINLRGAVLHVIGDLVQSIGVALAGALIWWKQVIHNLLVLLI